MLTYGDAPNPTADGGAGAGNDASAQPGPGTTRPEPTQATPGRARTTPTDRGHGRAPQRKKLRKRRAGEEGEGEGTHVLQVPQKRHLREVCPPPSPMHEHCK